MKTETVSRIVSSLLGAVCGAVVFATAAFAQGVDSYLGVPVDAMAGTYMATANANLRASPKQEGRRLGVLRQGTEVEAVGRKGAWIAVRTDGEDIGFVYEPLLKIIVLPPLNRDSQGRVLDDEGNPIAPASGLFMVAADVNLRSEPSAKATKRGQIEEGRKVTAFGSAKDGEWLAVRRDGKELGFVIAEALVPLIDGRLEGPLNGRSVTTPVASCAYEIRFTGKGAVQGEAFQTSDYDIDWRCTYEGMEIDFFGFMFITEAPFRAAGPSVYQISIDLFEVEVGYDESFSTVFLYDRDARRVFFDGVNIERFGADPAIKEANAAAVSDALAAAASLAPSAWSTTLWDALVRKQGGG